MGSFSPVPQGTHSAECVNCTGSRPGWEAGASRFSAIWRLWETGPGTTCLPSKRPRPPLSPRGRERGMARERARTPLSPQGSALAFWPPRTLVLLSLGHGQADLLPPSQPSLENPPWSRLSLRPRCSHGPGGAAGFPGLGGVGSLGSRRHQTPWEVRGQACLPSPSLSTGAQAAGSERGLPEAPGGTET